VLLMALTVSSGAVDAISFLAHGKVFTAFMTGNIVSLGLLIAANGPDSTAILVSMAAFAVGFPSRLRSSSALKLLACGLAA
jgi:uncharacterized membrane protein YoaK (UPF0700 family)